MGNPTKEQLENIRDNLDWIADKRKELDDEVNEFIELAEENGIVGPAACELAAAAQPQPDGKSAARVAIRVILGVDIGEEPPEESEDENEQPVEEEEAGEAAREPEAPEAEEPAVPTEEQLDAIRDEMQSVCDAQTEWDSATADLYKAAEKAGVSEEFADAAIDAVKDGRAGEDVDEAFELAKEEIC